MAEVISISTIFEAEKESQSSDRCKYMSLFNSSGPRIQKHSWQTFIQLVIIVTQHFPRGATQNTIPEDMDRCFTCTDTCPYRQDATINELGKTGLTSLFNAGLLRTFF